MLRDVRKGKQVGVLFGRKEEIIAVIVPDGTLELPTGLKLGLLEGEARIQAKVAYKMTDEESFPHENSCGFPCVPVSSHGTRPTRRKSAI